MAETEQTWKDWIEGYIKEFVIYVAKDPKDFFVRLVHKFGFFFTDLVVFYAAF